MVSRPVSPGGQPLLVCTCSVEIGKSLPWATLLSAKAVPHGGLPEGSTTCWCLPGMHHHGPSVQGGT